MRNIIIKTYLLGLFDKELQKVIEQTGLDTGYNNCNQSQLTKDDILEVFKKVEESIYKGNSDNSKYSGIFSEFDDVNK